MKHKCIAVSALAILSAASVYPQVNYNTAPSRTVGHPVTPQIERNSLYSAAPNLVEGRELYQPQGIAVDPSSNPPAIFVSDTLNNRVLGWKNATGFSNGAKADIVIGQNDFFTTWPQGPGLTPHAPNQASSLQTGLNSPTGLAVLNGNLYVVDSGNNRVLRFPTPFASADHFPDLVIGQPNFGSRTANWTGAVGPQGISLATGGTVYQANIAFDQAGNLWMTDPGNRRVLEFAAADVANTGAMGLTAVLEIGQPNMTTGASGQTNLNPNAANAALTANQFAVPAGIAFDPQGRLYVSDADPNQPQQLSRVLVFEPPFQNAMTAKRIMGVFFQQAGTTASQAGATVLDDPSSIFFDPAGQWMGVADTGYSRILIFKSYNQWPPLTGSLQVSPQADGVVGHNDFTSLNPNNTPQQGATYTYAPSPYVFSRPGAAVFYGGELYVADTGNNRAMVMPLQPSSTAGGVPTFTGATRVLGQQRMDTGAPNFIEGREFSFVTQFTSGTTIDAGVAVDNTGDTPHLYVADTGNNRILAYKDMRQVGPGVAADLIIGQRNGQTNLCNSPIGDPGQPSSSSLCSPVGLLVDSAGNLWVADRGNGRVLRFPQPFAQTGQPQADLVLGQKTFTSKITDPSTSTMAAPYGIALTVTGSLMVSDQAHNRVLVFTPVNGAFTNGQAAAKVIGQSDFTSTTAGNDSTSLNSPHHIAVDTDSRLYVTDTSNNRVLIFDSLDRLPVYDATAALSVAASAPEAVYVSPVTGEIWIGGFNTGVATRYPRYDQLFVGATANFNLSMPSAILSLTQDKYGALIAADATNRVALYYPQMSAQNAANFVLSTQRAFAPGMIATLWPFTGTSFTGAGTATASAYPLPVVLGDVQVLFNGTPAPMFYTSPAQINFYVPMRDALGNPTQTSGFATIEVVRKSTSQVLGAVTVQMNQVAPALFLNPPDQVGTSRLAAIINSDGTVNSATNPAARGTYISLYGTGQGFIANGPADGTPATGAISADPSLQLRVWLGSDFTDCSGCVQGNGDIQYSGLAPGYVGLWQINVKIPPLVDPTKAATLMVMLNSVPSAGAGSLGIGYNTQVYVK